MLKFLLILILGYFLVRMLFVQRIQRVMNEVKQQMESGGREIEDADWEEVS